MQNYPEILYKNIVCKNVQITHRKISKKSIGCMDKKTYTFFRQNCRESVWILLHTLVMDNLEYDNLAMVNL